MTWYIAEGRYITVVVSEKECQIRFTHRSNTGINIVMYTYLNPKLGELSRYVDDLRIGELASILDQRFEQVIESEFVTCNTDTGMLASNIDFENGNVYLFGYKIKISDSITHLSANMRSNLLFQLINGMGI
mgnify:CR=1 FL=1